MRSRKPLPGLPPISGIPDSARTCVRYSTRVGTWHDPDLGRPIAAPLERCAELLGIDFVTLREAATTVEPYVRADGTRIWSLMQLERQLRPEAYAPATAATSTTDEPRPATHSALSPVSMSLYILGCPTVFGHDLIKKVVNDIGEGCATILEELPKVLSFPQVLSNRDTLGLYASVPLFSTIVGK